MIGPGDRLLSRNQGGRDRAVVPFLLAAQKREIQLSYADVSKLMPGGGRPSGIGIRKRMAEITPTGRRVSLDKTMRRGMPGSAV